jgi:hypothetical protein
VLHVFDHVTNWHNGLDTATEAPGGRGVLLAEGAGHQGLGREAMAGHVLR